MSQSIEHDLNADLEAIDHYSDGEDDHPQEIMVELQESFPTSTSDSAKSTKRS